VEYYEPKDFKIGATINVFGRRFLIYDMDAFTKQFYRDHFGYTDFTPVCIDNPKPVFPKPVRFTLSTRYYWFSVRECNTNSKHI